MNGSSCSAAGGSVARGSGGGAWARSPAMPFAERSSRAFTLIELLVVVAIVALLISVLLPSLARAREQAREVKCLSNLRQLGLLARYYANDFKGLPLPTVTYDVKYYWHNTYNTLYASQALLGRAGDAGQNLICPSTDPSLDPAMSSTAQDVNGDGVIDVHFGSARHCWKADSDTTGTLKGGYSSYGANLWFQVDTDFSGFSSKKFFRTLEDARPASTVPLFVEANWVGGWPEYERQGSNDVWDIVPSKAEELETGFIPHQKRRFMGRFCINRHRKRVNVVFADGAARPVALRMLWDLDWHVGYLRHGPVQLP